MRFSQRIGKKSVRESMQIESMDAALENRLWNNFLNDLFQKISPYSHQSGGQSDRQGICQFRWDEFFENRADEIPGYGYRNGVDTESVKEYIKEWYFDAEWFEKYDFIEFLSPIVKKVFRIDFAHVVNQTLERESAGYRIVENKVVQITSEEEVSAIEEAIDNSSNNVETHLRTALELLSKRESPDYRNSVKESISAVEAFCISMTGDNKATLGKALKKIEATHNIHKAYKSAFSSLYGFTSDSSGIRHALLEDDQVVTMEDAKFMLVSCSAFINYLSAKIQ